MKQGGMLRFTRHERLYQMFYLFSAGLMSGFPFHTSIEKNRIPENPHPEGMEPGIRFPWNYPFYYRIVEKPLK
jgi:hypothetical protein